MTPLMWRVLELARDKKDLYENCTGQSEFGGRASVIVALGRRGLIQSNHEITAQGRAELIRRASTDAGTEKTNA
jgi:hypothetical protein